MRRARRMLTPAGLTVIGVAAVAALLANARPPAAPPAGDLQAPPILAGSALVAAIRGPAALAELARLHGRRIEAVDGLVARYGGGLTVWISASSSPPRTTMLLFEMTRRLAGAATPFTAPRALEISGRTVFATDGLGQRHYYYQSGSLAIWLAAPPSVADATLRKLLQVYP